MVVKPQYFNILNQGGSTSTIVNGLCSQTPGSPIYGAVCQNKGWLMTNTTWFQLQSYHAEFAINRKDFGLLYPGKADDLIRDGVVIKLTLKVPRKP